MTDASVNGRKQGWLAWLVLIPVLIAAAVIGFFVFVVILGLVLFIAAVLMARLWWLRRKMRKTAVSQVLEGEYVVIRSHTVDGGSVEREAGPTGKNAGVDHPQPDAHDKDVR